tara:strand:- start:123 stop:320 length:198 start_codon:yes stop_codon:yes gene_type:complete
MLISVMRDMMVGCEEVFELDVDVCDAWIADVTVADGFDDVEAEEGEEEVCWCKFFESCSLCFGKK